MSFWYNNHEIQKAMAKSKLRAGAKAKIKGIKLDLSKKCLHLNALAFNLFGIVSLFMAFMRVEA